MLSVLIRIDAAGETPLLVGEDEALCPDPDVRWRHVANVDDRAKGEAMVARLKRRPEFWNLDYNREAESLARPTCNPCSQ